MVDHYSDLQGALDSSSYYRPRRYRARQWLSPLANARIRIGAAEYPVADLSTNGAALLSPPDGFSWPVGAELDASLMLHGREAQCVRARVVRRENGPAGVRVGLGLTKGFLDLDAVSKLDADLHFAHQVSVKPAAEGARVPAAVRDVVAETAYFVQYYRRCLEPREAGARASGEEAVRALAERTYPAFSEGYDDLRARASRAALSCFDDKKTLEAAKAYTETMLTPLLVPAPIVYRSYVKPLGYPGDYQVMLYSYGDDFEGETAYAKLIHKLVANHPLSVGVRTRKNYVARHLRDEFARLRATDAECEFKVTSLGCGPAREVSEFVESESGWAGSMRFRLIDQEERALQVAFDTIQRQLSRTASRGAAECFNLSFSQLLKNPALLSRFDAQHFVYSTGLFDYLPPRIAQRLLDALYGCLKPGGLLLVGNAQGPNEHFFCPEFAFDWPLVYRTRDEMLDLVKPLPESARVEVELEPGGAYWFLKIRKGY